MAIEYKGLASIKNSRCIPNGIQHDTQQMAQKMVAIAPW